MTTPGGPLGPTLDKAASDAERMAGDLRALLPRFRSVTAQVNALIGGAAGKEDKAMAQRLEAAARRASDAAGELGKAASYARAAARR